ncbi:hypothetical protein ACFLT7_04680 [candidate division KSB1 bacterium]
MRQLCIMAAALMVLTTSTQAQLFHETDTSFKPHFSIKATGGWARWSMTDWNNYYGFFLGSKQLWIDIDGDQFYWGNDGELEIVYSFHPQMRIGAGIHRAWGSGGFDWEDSQDWPEEPKNIRNETIDVAATPLYFTFYISGTSYPNRPYIGFGVGYYPTSLTMHSEYQLVHQAQDAALDSSSVRDGDMSASGIGYHAIMGTEYFITPKIALVAEAKGRLAKFSGFSGKVTQTLNNGTPVETDGEFTYYETPQLTFLGMQPAGTEVPVYFSPREAELDFTGVSLKLGIAYHF